MRDKRYIAIHRGGPLTPERHRLLAVWAADCAEQVLPLFHNHYPQDNRPAQAIAAARAWSRDEITVGAARAAAVAAHAAAREADAAAARFVARATGHAVATAHMADHAPGAAMYAIKAVKAAADQVNMETAVAHTHQWQKEHLPAEIRELVLFTFVQKYAYLGL
jgi:hypothetical protein